MECKALSYNVDEFDYSFDEKQVAIHPLKDRESAKLLHCQTTSMDDLFIRDLPNLLKDTLIIINDTKVLNARLFIPTENAKPIEVFLLEWTPNTCTWKILAKPLKKLKIDHSYPLTENISLIIDKKEDGFAVVRFSCNMEEMWEYIETSGNTPIPPYLNRDADESDKTNYQSMFAENIGSVAAQTASFHFTENLKSKLLANNCEFASVTLHIGGGTFLPVKTDDIREHQMHSERYSIPSATYRKITEYLREGKNIVAVGTTPFRACESFWILQNKETLLDKELSTDLFLYPKKDDVYSSQIFTHIITNFHQPKSTLIMLICALLGTKRTKEMYRHAVKYQYRLFSYGDTGLLTLTRRKR